MTRYLTIDDAMQTVERLGFHVRDAGLLASALARASSSFAGTDSYATLDEKAAAMMESLVRNHSLVDGNKRSGWVLTQLFLYLNGQRHTFSTDEAFDLVVGLAEGRFDVQAVANQFAAHRRPR